MPAAFTHFLVAKEVLALLPDRISKPLSTDLSLYFFGAQGADFCFFYPLFHRNSPANNFGSFLHKKGGYGAFRTCKTFANHDKNAFAYSLGYITHYAADSVFHPYVYARAGKSPLQHSRIEAALDLYFKNLDKAPAKYSEYFPPKLTQKETNELFLLYASIAANAGFPPLVKHSFLRAISLFNAYLPRSSVFFGKEDPERLTAYINEEKRLWRYPADKKISSTADAKELFETAVSFACSAVDSFIACAKEKKPLPYTVFGKNYLTGI